MDSGGIHEYMQRSMPGTVEKMFAVRISYSKHFHGRDRPEEIIYETRDSGLQETPNKSLRPMPGLLV